jgi:hypothetical protein
MKNWKSLLAFLLFVFLYGWSVLTEMEIGVIEATGFIALYAMAFMMLRNEALAKVAESLTEIVKAKLGK